METIHQAGWNRSSTGVSGLDDILHGGLISDRLYLLEGDPGAGKTTLALQFLREGYKNNEKCLYITLSETKEELAAGAASHGWTIEGIEIIELISENGETADQPLATMYHPSEVELSETTRRVLDAVNRVNPSVGNAAARPELIALSSADSGAQAVFCRATMHGSASG